MQYEKSCGAVVVERSGESPKFLCVLQKAGHWSLPKGHATEDENEKVAAVDRIKNETGLDVQLLGEFRIEARYAPKPETMKTVVFFLGEVTGGTQTCNPREIQACEWLTLAQAKDRVLFEDIQEVLDQADAYLRAL